jgi:hypothetical protein
MADASVPLLDLSVGSGSSQSGCLVIDDVTLNRL